jgi:glucose/arabinose dehydrogenase
MNSLSCVCTALVFLLVSSSLPLHAQNVINDGNFEQAPQSVSSGSTVYGSDPSVAAAAAFDSFWTIQNNVAIDTADSYVFAGSNSLLLTEDNSQLTDGITQTVTTPGSLYTLSFYANSDGPNTFSVLFGGQAVSGSPTSIPQNGFPFDTSTSGSNPNASEFTYYSFPVSTTSASTALTFQGSSDSTLELDGISLVPVPEASASISFGLLLCLGGLAVMVSKRKKAGSACVSTLAAVGLLGTGMVGTAHAQTVTAAYQGQMEIQTLATGSEYPAQMAWGPDGRLYVATAFGDVISYAYNIKTGALTERKTAVPNVAGLGIAFYHQNMYVSTFNGILKLDDKNGNGIWGETSAGELKVPIVTGIPVGDHDVDQLQIQGSTLYVGLGRRTLNGYSGAYTSAQLDDFGGKGFDYGGTGTTLGDCAYGGTIGWIKNLDAVPDTPGAANVYTSSAITPSLIQDDSPYTTQANNKLVVHSAGARNPFGLCFDAAGRLWFTNNYNRNPTRGDGTVGPGYFEDMPGPDFSHDIQDELFQASPGADYGYADANWRGTNPMLTPGTPGYHRVLSTTFDNLYNPGPYTLHDPANPDGLGPSSSADGCGFFYSGHLPASLYGSIFIARWNDAITESANGGVQHTLKYSDIVAVNTSALLTAFSTPSLSCPTAATVC